MIKDIEQIRAILKNDGVIAFVTDTVWGLGCLPTSEKAVKKIYEIKHREAKKPLILMSNEVYNLFHYVKNPICKEGQKLIKQFFPGALTVILDKSENTPDYLTSNMPTVEIRVPDNKVFAELCSHIEGHVLATTSANISGEPPALTYDEAVKYIGDKVDYVIEDYDYKAAGKASTVVGFKDEKPVIYRQGDVII